MDKTELFNRIKGKLIISCQALPGEPLYDPERTLMPYMARAAREAGSPMIRANTVRDVLGIKKETGLPVIGLIKQVYEGYDGYITPTMREVDALAEAGADTKNSSHSKVLDSPEQACRSVLQLALSVSANATDNI